MLKSESRRPKPNAAVVQELMDITFEQCHKDVTEKQSLMTSLLDKYPFLQDENQVNV